MAGLVDIEKVHSTSSMRGVSDNVQGLRTGPNTFASNTGFLRSITSAHRVTQLVAGARGPFVKRWNSPRRLRLLACSILGLDVTIDVPTSGVPYDLDQDRAIHHWTHDVFEDFSRLVNFHRPLAAVGQNLQPVFIQVQSS